MHEIDLYSALSESNLFAEFEFQVRKDFEGAGLPIDEQQILPTQLEHLKTFFTHLIFEKKQTSQLPQLLYRIDISEQQIKKYGLEHPSLAFEDLISELIIKRELQKIILRKRYSSKS